MIYDPIRECDKCKRKVEKDEQFWALNLRAQERSTRYKNIEDEYPTRSIDVCRPCLESFGIYTRNKPEPEKLTPPGIEAMLREILSLMGVRFEDA